jgi:cysteine synthase
MDQLEYEQMLRRREKLLAFVNGEFAPIEPVPVPKDIASAGWFKESGLANTLKTYAFCGFRLEYALEYTGKLPAALKILLEEEAAGHLDARPVIVAATSGNFGFAAALLTVSVSRVFDIPKFIAVVEPTTSAMKQAFIRRSGATVIVAPQGMTAIQYADETYGQRPGYLVINQYTHPGNLHGQEWVANKIHRTLGLDVSVFVASVGSTASVSGGGYLRKLVPHLKVVGVASMSEEDRVPGSRTEAAAEVGGFDYRSWLSYPLVTSVTKREAFAASDELIGNLIFAGPTSGLAVAGFYHLLSDEYRAGRLDAIRNPSGDIVAVFDFKDPFYVYSEEYDKVLGIRS